MPKWDSNLHQLYDIEQNAGIQYMFLHKDIHKIKWVTPEPNWPRTNRISFTLEAAEDWLEWFVKLDCMPNNNRYHGGMI